MIETPSDSQKYNATILHAAQMLASGRLASSVQCELKKRGMEATEIEANWNEIKNQGNALISVRRRSLRLMGFSWLGLGLLMFSGIAWALSVHGVMPFILMFGIVPFAYGIYLLRLPPTQELSIEPPKLFGRNL